MTRQQIIDRIMKVKALACRGTDGERTAAQRLLEELMEKYHIDEADIDTEKKEVYIIDAGDPIFKDLFQQIYHVKFGRDRGIWVLDKMPKKYKREFAELGHGDKDANLAIECTKAEFIEVKMLFEIYKSDLKSQLGTFMYAYFHKNDLLLPANPEHDCTEEEERRALKALFMARGIEKKEIHKMIESAQ